MKRDRKTATFANKHCRAAAAGFTGGRPGREEKNGRGNPYPAAPARALFCQGKQRRAFKPWPFLRLLPREVRRRLQPGGGWGCQSPPAQIPPAPPGAKCAGLGWPVPLPESPATAMRISRRCRQLHTASQWVAWFLIPGAREVPSLSLGSGVLGTLGQVRSDRRSPAKSVGAQPFPPAHANEVKPAFPG